MTLGMMTGLHDAISVHDFGLDNKTAADGLAVGTASGFVGKTMQPFIDGCYTVSDNNLFSLLKLLADKEGIYLEPSALAGMPGPVNSIQAEAEKADAVEATHMVWATGGGMVPEEEIKRYYEMAGK